MSEISPLIRALRAAHQYKIADDLEFCGKNIVVFVGDKPGEVKFAPAMCKSRWCPKCNAVHRDQIGKKIRTYFEFFPEGSLRFCTITQRDRAGESLMDAAKRFEASWQKLRRTKLWKSHVIGAIKKIEVTRNYEKGWWHYHAHLILHGAYLSEHDLREKWHDITGDSFKCDLKMIDHSTYREMTKYLTKLTSFDSNSLAEIVSWSRRVREHECYGDMRIPLKPEYKTIDSSKYSFLGTIQSCFHGILLNDPNPRLLIFAQYCVDNKIFYPDIDERFNIICRCYIDKMNSH